MTNALNVISEEKSVDTGITDQDALATALGDILADTYRLTFKTHVYHWNVAGPMFFAVHNLTEGQYENMFAAADELAERIRAIGKLAPSTLNGIVGDSVIEDKPDILSAGDMCEDLAADHERIAHRLHALVELAGKHKDPVTEDLATARSAFHEKAVWMLRALCAE
ncbi:starvation-inducible DNA-binding protein [Cognatiyoonia koreensis]|uniref:Starvation-inducible DNA-binding protein n=1 Tax=Cognatiyoonia koreensis TaxID=364200 RepID=A0A1I0PX73_9RHOB|nr:DNA starvation/stationary phase protection protein [Cognatiyoonia koreensis]SEW19044.1 starvation-inducible DNA-binding protein [Cognatiyoonia koreensis]